MKRFYIHLRGDFYSLGPISAKSKQAARQWVREWLKVKRLPRGTEIYETQ